MAAETVFILNDALVRASLPAGSVLLDFIRGEQRLTGTREGCREGDCGACSVLLGTLEGDRVRYRAVNSCLFPLAEAAGRHVVTIEGLNGPGLTPVQQAIVNEGASQCGFCTPGIVVSLTGFLLEDAVLDYEDGITAIEGNVCRCTGYTAIRRAVERLVREVGPRLAAAPERRVGLIAGGIVPAYFAGIPARLKRLPACKNVIRPKRDAVLVAGGTDLYVQRGCDLPEKEILLLSRREGFSSVWPSQDRITIGAATPIADLMASPLLAAAFPSLPGFLRLVSSVQIRHRATVGGNIVNASPIGDLSVILLALDARIGLRGERKPREVELADFFQGYKKLDLKPGELAAWLSVPVPHDGFLFHFEKVARRRHQDIASVNSAIGLQMDGERIAAARASAGGVAPVPLYLRKASAFLTGRTVSPTMVKEFVTAAEDEIAPISDVRGSAAYKRTLLRRLLFAHFLELFPGRLQAGDLP